MKKLTLLSALFLFGILKCASQDTIFVLHPVIGDTIDKNDMFDYGLFPDMSGSNFKYGLITYSSDKFFLKTCTLTDSILIKQIDTTEIKFYIEGINKLIDFYTNELKKDSVDKSKGIFTNSTVAQSNTLNAGIIDNETRKRMESDLRVSDRLKSDAERFKNFELGTDAFGNSAQFQWKHKRKK